MNSLKHLHQQWLWKRQQKQHRLAQGRLTVAEAAAKLPTEGHIPLAAVPGQTVSDVITIPAEADGHLLLVAPPDSRWRQQLAAILIRWPGAALVVDPDGLLYNRTGHLRDTTWGKVYAIPGYRFNLAYYYPFWDGDAAVKLHNFLLPPAPVHDEWLLDHVVPLIQALGHYCQHYKRNPMQALLDAADTNLYYVLEALETAPAARPHARCFTKGLSIADALSAEDVVYAFALFAHQMRRYQKTYGSFAIDEAEDVLPLDWADEPNTVYLTCSLNKHQKHIGLMAAFVDGLRRYHHTYGRYSELLLVIDTTLAQRLPPIEQVLTEAATYGITIILTAVSLPALNGLAANGDGVALAGRFSHQVWYPPHDRRTAEHMAWLYGTELPQTAEGSHPEPKLVLTPHEVLAWSNEQVLVYTRQERPYRFLAERVTMPPDLSLRLPPVPPRQSPPPRDHLAWLPPQLAHSTYEIEPLLGEVVVDDSLEIADDGVPGLAEVETANQTVPDAGSTPDGDNGVQPPSSSSAPQEEEPPATLAESNTPSHRAGKNELR